MGKAIFAKAVTTVFEKLTPDLDRLYASAHSYSLPGWRTFQQSLVTATGAGSVAIPVAHLATMFADLAFLMNRMSVCSYGIGAILGFQAGEGNLLEAEDFAVVLSRWSGDDSLSNATVAKTAAGLTGHVGGKTIAKLLAKVAAENAGVLIGKKLGMKASAKIAGKFATKLGTKAIEGFIPFVGPAIGGGINLWFVTSIANEAERWYRLKLSLADSREGNDSGNPAPAS